MATRTHRWTLLAGCLLFSSQTFYAQVFVVGEKSATEDISTSFSRTNLPLSDQKLNERGRRELVRNLEAEQGFAHRPLPIGVLSLEANGELSPGGEKYREMIYKKGQAAAPGDRVVVTALNIKGDRIVLDFNGGPYAKHRFLSHIQLNNAPVAANTGERPMGSRVELVFPKGIPDISAPEVKALLEPVVDFGVKSGERAYADTLPPKIRNAIAAHEVLVGMNHRMVLAALGAPESKVREKESGDANGSRYEEWIYGHVPQTVKFIRFKGDHVAQVQIAALGKPIELHDKNELEEGDVPVNTRQIALGDKVPAREGEDASAPPAPPSLRLPGEASEPVNAQGKVQYPTDKEKDKDKDRRLDRQPIPAAPGSPADTSADDQQQQQTSPMPGASQSRPGYPTGYPNQTSPYPQTQPGAPYPQNTPGQPRSRTQP